MRTARRLSALASPSRAITSLTRHAGRFFQQHVQAVLQGVAGDFEAHLGWGAQRHCGNIRHALEERRQSRLKFGSPLSLVCGLATATSSKLRLAARRECAGRARSCLSPTSAILIVAMARVLRAYRLDAAEGARRSCASRLQMRSIASWMSLRMASPAGRLAGNDGVGHLLVVGDAREPARPCSDWSCGC